MEKALQYLKEYFGYTSFRRGQAEAINDILNGHDTFVLMPTGGGKSIIYQIPALIFDGLTIVISPLISLMKDQVDTLNSMGINSTYINSTLSSSEIEQREMNIKNNKYKLLYIAPERLEALKFFLGTNDIDVSLIAIDEAHCVSQWGHDFRPSYRNISSFISLLPSNPIVLACTATATEIVKNDIVTLLGLRNANLYCTGFNRENLNFKVFRGENKESFILDYVNAHTEETGIIYTATRKSTEHLYSVLMKKGFKAGLYHGGLSEEKRKEMQDAFMFDDINIMVATNAFGMGIDKSNVRYVIHNNMTKNLEAYYQEAGRAGRDGENSECILLFSSGDIQTQKFFIDNSPLPPNIKMQEYNNLRAMVDYCYTSKCLRSYILNYFGEESESNCNNCSNCNEDNELKDVTNEAMMIFSTIYRIKERFGITVVIDVLKGSQNQRMISLGFDKLSTHGLMSKYDRKFIEEVINKLIAENFLASTDEEFPRVVLTPKAIAAIKNKENVFLSFRKQLKKAKNDSKGLHKDLLIKLKELRRALSEELQVPPYIIFHDTTLKEMSDKLPRTKEDFLEIKGVGLGKFEKYGEKFLDAIREYIAYANISEVALSESASINKNIPDPSKDSSEPVKEKSHIITLNLYNQGQSLDEISENRNLSITTVQEHIIHCALEGEKVNLDDFIPDGTEDIILSAIEELGASKLKPLKDVLPKNIGYMTIKAVICKHQL